MKMLGWIAFLKLLRCYAVLKLLRWCVALKMLTRHVVRVSDIIHGGADPVRRFLPPRVSKTVQLCCTSVRVNVRHSSVLIRAKLNAGLRSWFPGVPLRA